MLISSPRIPTPISAIIFHHRVCVRRHHGFVLHRHEEYGALVVGIAFAIYPLVPKLPQQPEVKPDKYTLFG